MRGCQGLIFSLLVCQRTTQRGDIRSKVGVCKDPTDIGLSMQNARHAMHAFHIPRTSCSSANLLRLHLEL